MDGVFRRRQGLLALAHPLLLAILLVVVLAFLPGCGPNPPIQQNCQTNGQSPPPSTPSPTQSYSSENETRTWVRNVVAVSARLERLSAKEAAQDFTDTTQSPAQAVRACVQQKASSVSGVIAIQFYNGANGLPWYTVTPGTITFFFEQQLSQSAVQADADGDTHLIQVINQINMHLGEIAPIPVGSSTIVLQGASPDWLGGATGFGDHIGGSPGGPPLQASNPQTLSSTQQNMQLTKPIFVLDTAYTSLNGSSAHQGVGQCGSFSCVPSAQSITLNGVQEPFQVADLGVFADQPSPGQGTPPYELIPGTTPPVEIQDHGLFISNVLHELAPQAPIKLIRVLNDYGVTDLQTVLFALQSVACSPERLEISKYPDLCDTSIQAGEAGSLLGVINLSLDFEPPLDCLSFMWSLPDGKVPTDGDQEHPCGTPPITTVTPVPTVTPVTNITNWQALLMPAFAPLNDLHQVGFTIVAAAGNDSSSGPHLNPDVPAAFCGIFSVAALDPTQGPSVLATFSNNTGYRGPSGCLQPLQPANGGITSDSRHQTQVPGVNICSIYPHYSTGYALWSGTSFATAIVSANITGYDRLPSGLFIPPSCPASAPAHEE